MMYNKKRIIEMKNQNKTINIYAGNIGNDLNLKCADIDMLTTNRCFSFRKLEPRHSLILFVIVRSF